MRKLIILFVLLTLSVGLWAEQVSHLYPVYVDNDPTKGIASWQIGNADATEITNATTALNAGWYVVKGADVQTGTLVCNGAVNIILADGAKLTATGVQDGEFVAGTPGIQVSGNGNSLSIYVQSTALTTMGQLIATGQMSAAGIGGGFNQNSSNITINGGKVTATGRSAAAGIGGGAMGNGSHITINGGEVTATGGDNGAGIGGGNQCNGTNITINGGKVMATGMVYAAGIGGGGSGIGSYITINGGEVTATGGSSGGAGIGGGDEGSGSNIFVTTYLILKADGNNPPTTVIENDGTDLASKLAGKQYVTLVVNLATAKTTATAEINDAVDGVTDTDILAIATTAIANINNATTVDDVNSIKMQALADIALAKAQIAAIAEINDAVDGVTDTDILAIATTAIANINNATTVDDVNSIKIQALADIDLAKAKADAIAAINEAINDLTLFPKEQEYIENQIEHIKSIKIEESVEAVNSTKNATLAFIALHDAKVIAVAAVKHDMGDYAESEAIYDLIGGPAIEAAISADKITEAKNAALAKLEEVSVVLGDAATVGYNKGKEDGKAEALGALGTPQSGNAVEVIDQNGKVLKLYNPKTVNFIKVEDKE